jgi:hypothetical protein
VARWADQWNSLPPSPAAWHELRDVLEGHCEREGRDPAGIESSVNVRYDRDAGPGAMVEEAAAFGDVGVDLVVVGMPAPHDPADVEVAAEALRELAEA